MLKVSYFLSLFVKSMSAVIFSLFYCPFFLRFESAKLFSSNNGDTFIDIPFSVRTPSVIYYMIGMFNRQKTPLI